MDSRLTTSGMTEGRWTTSGMTAGRIVRPCLPHSVMPDVSPLSFPPDPSLLFPLSPSGLPALPFWSSRSPLLVFPLSPSVIPAKAGIQCLSSVPFIRGPRLGKTHGFPITNVGNDRGAMDNVGHDSGQNRAALFTPLLSCPPVPPSVMSDVPPSVMPAGSPFCHARCSPFVMSALPFCHSRESGNPVSFFFVPFIRGPRLGKALDSRLKMSGMTSGRLKMSGMTEGD